MIRKATAIINKNIGSFSTDITDTRFIADVEELCLTMVKRMQQIDTGQGMAGNIPMFSPNDFLIERERVDLKNYGFILKHRTVGKWVF